MLVVFDALNIYYLPQFLPVFRELKRAGHQSCFVCYLKKNKKRLFEPVFKQLGVDCHWVKSDKEAADLYGELKPDWIIFGNRFQHLDQVHRHSKTAQMGHGVGSKPCYYHDSSAPMTVRFMEGKLRLAKIRELYPLDNFTQVGFSKLDPLFNGQEPGLDFSGLGLDPSRETILYAPTFNPSSLECFPDDWPAEFDKYNILIKPHSLTTTRKRYWKQQAKLRKWARFPNVHVGGEEHFSLLPFMKDADIMLSDASSAVFEFAALGRPIIICNFFKLKWSYRGPFRYRFERRFRRDNVLFDDLGIHVEKYEDLIEAIPAQLSSPEQFEEDRKRYTLDHVGETDGKASKRIVDYLEKWEKHPPGIRHGMSPV